ncbi:MAG TPA: 1-deoxy-D-xylulose-5-phosphate synthase, partial [Elusimicrobiota bacterium]|nr:1-deoxy-D-xylulose-5-phosphate synthase [Elusimicrobiota bacterium]
MNILDMIDKPQDLRNIRKDLLPILAKDIRQKILDVTSQVGGHLGAGLGTVELAIALHYVFESPKDKIIWDTGHQAYPHKLLTGRRDRFHTLRQFGGISGFLSRNESEHDVFGAGHASTSISAALGFAAARDVLKQDHHVIAVANDGSLTGGMAFEALQNAGHLGTDLLVVLNDNQMSISRNEGGLASAFARLWASPLYNNMREGGKRVLSRLPGPALEIARRTEEHMKGMVAPGTLFEELGFNYIGPIDGHDLPLLVSTLGNVSELKGAQLLHVMTVKGKGFAPAERDPVGYHAIDKIDPSPRVAGARPRAVRPKYQDVFGAWLCDMAERDRRLTGITPAMCEGSGMGAFARRFPERFHDVAIAEQHAVTLAAGLACEGMKPVVAIYSTFLQRAYDQLIHDVALKNLDVLFA